MPDLGSWCLTAVRDTYLMPGPIVLRQRRRTYPQELLKMSVITRDHQSSRSVSLTGGPPIAASAAAAPGCVRRPP